MNPSNNPSDNPFPLERLFPGIHAARPDVAAYEGEMFLEYGAKPSSGVDLADPAVRARMLDGPGEFMPFPIAPLPADLAARVAKLPADWQEDERTFAEVEAINIAIEERYALAPRFYVSLDEDRDAIVGENR